MPLHAPDLRSAIVWVALAFAGSTNALAAAADGLAPCEADNSYRTQVDAAIDQPPAGKLLLGFTSLPSFETEWGIRILRNTKNEAILRVVEFKDSVWASAYQEEPKGSFQRNPAKANLKRKISDIVISEALLRQLLGVVSREVSAASTANGEFGLDGTAYYFTSGGKSCARTWSPASASRAGNLVAIFESLRTLPGTPTSVLRSYRETVIAGKLKKDLPK